MKNGIAYDRTRCRWIGIYQPRPRAAIVAFLAATCAEAIVKYRQAEITATGSRRRRKP